MTAISMTSIMSVNITLMDNFSSKVDQLINGVNQLNNSFTRIEGTLKEICGLQSELLNKETNTTSIIQQQISLTNVLQVSIQEATQQEDKLNNSISNGSSQMEKIAEKAKNFINSFLGVDAIKNGIEKTISEAVKMQGQMISVQGMLGNKEAGSAYFNHLQKEANKSGFAFEDLQNNARNFLGITKNTDSLDTLTNLSERLSLGNTSKGLKDAGSAIKDMMSGKGDSLKSDFGFNDEDIGILKASKNMDDFTSKFDNLLNKKGLNADMLGIFNNSATSQFDNLKSNLNTALGTAGQGVLEALVPIMAMINEMFSNGSFQPFFEAISIGLTGIANIVAWVCKLVIDNGDLIVPVLAGLISGIAALKIAMIGYSIIQGISNLLTTDKAIVDGAAIATQWGLNTALLACPLTWIIIAIIAVIAALIAWSIYTNGLQATWLIFTNALLTAWDVIKLSAVLLANGVMDAFDYMCIGAMSASVGIKNAFGDMRAGGLMILQDFVNGSIDIINDLINSVNNIPGVGIKAISHVTFGTEAQVENAADKAARNAELANYIAEKQDAKQKRDGEFNNMLSEAATRLDERKANIAQAKLDAQSDKNKDNLDFWNKLQGQGNLPMNNIANTINSPLGNNDNNQLNNNVAQSAKSLDNMDSKIDISNEHLEMLRDLAEQESIQNFVSLTPTVQITTGDVKEEADINKIISRIENYMETQLANSAEGLYA